MKIVKIILITLAVLILAVLGAFIAFPKSMAQLAVKSDTLGNFDNVDKTTSTYEHYDVKTPDSFKETAMYGLSLRLPENAARRDEDKNKAGYHIFDGGDSLTVNYIDPLKTSDGAQALYMPYEFIGKNEWKSESSALDKEVDGNNYAVSSVIRNFTFYDVKPRGGGVFFSSLRLATDKEAFCLYDKAWDFETEDAVGFLDFYGMDDGVYSYTLALYDKADLNEYRLAKISSTNEELIYQIVNSAKLAER